MGGVIKYHAIQIYESFIKSIIIAAFEIFNNLDDRKTSEGQNFN